MFLDGIPSGRLARVIILSSKTDIRFLEYIFSLMSILKNLLST